jgi:hypothetical protein
MKQVNYEDITLAGVTSWDVSAKKNVEAVRFSIGLWECLVLLLESKWDYRS